MLGRARALVLVDLALHNLVTGFHLQAMRHAEQAVAAARTGDSQEVTALAMLAPGSARANLGCEDGINLSAQSLQISRQPGFGWGIAIGLTNLSGALDEHLRPEEAVTLARPGVAELERLGLHRSVVPILKGCRSVWRPGARWTEHRAVFGPMRRGRFLRPPPVARWRGVRRGAARGVVGLAGPSGLRAPHSTERRGGIGRASLPAAAAACGRHGSRRRRFARVPRRAAPGSGAWKSAEPSLVSAMAVAAGRYGGGLVAHAAPAVAAAPAPGPALGVRLLAGSVAGP